MAVIRARDVKRIEVVEGIITVVYTNPERPGRTGDGSPGVSLGYLDLTVEAFRAIAERVDGDPDAPAGGPDRIPAGCTGRLDAVGNLIHFGDDSCPVHTGGF